MDVVNAAGTTTSAAATLNIAPFREPGRITNFSIRSRAGTGAQTLIVGFADEGGSATTEQTLLLRGVGPTLSTFGIVDALPDPKLELFRGRTKLGENDNWDVGSGADVLAARVNAFPLPPNSRDAVVVASALTPGAYTVQVTSATPAAGVALAEVFDATAPGSGSRALVNVSARTQVGAGEDVLIAGFALGGSSARTVLVRAAGPALTAFAVTGALADPKLTLFRGNTRIAESDNWQTSRELVGVFAATGAFDFNARSRDAVLLVTLAPGLYTAQVAGIGAGGAATGVALVEVYLLP